MNPNDSFVINTRGLSQANKSVSALQGLSLHIACYSIFGFLRLNDAGKRTTGQAVPGLDSPHCWQHCDFRPGQPAG